MPPSYAIYMFDPAQQTFLIVAAPPPGFMYTHPVAIQPRTEPNATDPTNGRRDARGAEHRPPRSAQRLRHRRPRPHGRRRPDRGRLRRGCTTAIAKTAPSRSDRHAPAGRRPGADEGPGERCLRLRAGALHPRGPRDRPAGRHDRHARGDRRDRVRDAADPRLRADRAGRLVQADRAGRHADRPGGRRCAAAAGSRRTPTGSRSGRASAAPATAATARVAAAPSTPAAVVNSDAGGPQDGAGRRRTSRARRWPLPARASTPRRCSLVADMIYQRHLGRHDQGRRDRAAARSRSSTPATRIRPTTSPPRRRSQRRSSTTRAHIAPLWTRNRGANTCTNCHNDPDKLDLERDDRRAAGRLESYDELMLGDPLIDRRPACR